MSKPMSPGPRLPDDRVQVGAVVVEQRAARSGRSRRPRRCPRRRGRASTGSSASARPCARSPSRAGRRGRGCRARSSRPSRACSPAIVTLAGFVPCAVSAVMIVSRCSPSPRSAKYARISIRPVSSPCEPAAGCSVTAGRPATSARICCSSHISSSAPCAPSSSWCGWRLANPGSRDDALVDPRVVLHRARAERVEARVDAEVPVGEVREVAHDLVLGELRQARRLLAGERCRAPRARASRMRHAPRPPPGLALLVDELHQPHTSARTSASRSTSAGVRFSVNATSSTSSMPS